MIVPALSFCKHLVLVATVKSTHIKTRQVMDAPQTLVIMSRSSWIQPVSVKIVSGISEKMKVDTDVNRMPVMKALKLFQSSADA